MQMYGGAMWANNRQANTQFSSYIDNYLNFANLLYICIIVTVE